MTIDFIFDGPDDFRLTIVLAHGAGAAMDSPFMDEMALGLAGRGYRVARFEFPYMAKRRVDGKKRGPDRAPVLIETYQQVVEQLGTPENLVIGGKSMGGRIASMVADDLGVRGVVCLGYPFHPPGKPENLRTAHLQKMKTPTLICHGTRDPFGSADEVAGYGLSDAVAVHWVSDGNHDFEARKKSGHTQEGNIAGAVAAIDDFVKTTG
ncbi:alpha/beta family hydrolase [Thalassospira sp. MCCC 1A03138]|uniref:alpha/beta family hydrolase n=1 Tax=Thalassospira sp. MCCC 1A03138 TaxID=1470576 RepID=UPI000A1E4566|nr:alpha/beta family hydrolase [Thalassospira sp. MCCC 1A03138]OSQ32182.1 alpha/beta hydrolase [Thalassospira sp. MCCC 1A03138]